MNKHFGAGKKPGKHHFFGVRMYDYGARMYDNGLGRWHTLDRNAGLYWHVSPYVYALNTPINAIDPDGKIVIFINGNHFGDGGSEKYWRVYKTETSLHQYGYTFGTRTQKYEVYAFDKAVMIRVNDHNAIYRDGSLGGFAPFNFKSLSLSNRYDAGYTQGMKDAEKIINNLARDKNGNIIESIKIITHSMGAA